MSNTVNGYPIRDLVGPPDRESVSRRLAQVRATIAGKLACVGPYTDERYVVVECVGCGGPAPCDCNEAGE
jgi:hypothetical protein